MKRTTLRETVFGLALSSVAGLSMLASAAHAGPTLTGDSMQTGVHICLAAHYDRPQVLCIRDDEMVSAANLHTARLQFSAIGSSFTSNKDTFKVWKLGIKGNTVSVGHTWAQQNTAFGLEAFRLDAVLNAAGARGTGVYEIQVRNGSTILGTRLVSVVP